MGCHVGEYKVAFLATTQLDGAITSLPQAEANAVNCLKFNIFCQLDAL